MCMVLEHKYSTVSPTVTVYSSTYNGYATTI
jgi:hypothetical protein